MKTRIFLLFLFALWLTACSSSAANTPTEPPVAQLDPTVKPTATLTLTAVPTATPPPTATPTPQPTATSVPTATPQPTATPRPTVTPVPAASLLPALDFETYAALMSVAESFYQDGDYAAAAVVYSELLLYEANPELRASLYALSGEVYAGLGDFDSAIEALLQATALGMDDDMLYTATLNNLCWYYALTNQPELALPYCEQAVTNDPSSTHRDSRGVVYALLGDMEAASADFQFVVDDLSSTPIPELVAVHDERAAWLEVLQAGENPITPEVLAQLQAESIVAVPTPVTKVNLTKELVIAAAEAQDVVFEAMPTEGGNEVFMGTWRDGDCLVVIGAGGPADGSDLLTMAVLSFSGCEAEMPSTVTGWFLSVIFYQDTTELARGYMWLIRDLAPLLAGSQTKSQPQEIGNTVLIAEAPTEQDMPALMIMIAVEPFE